MKKFNSHDPTRQGKRRMRAGGLVAGLALLSSLVIGQTTQPNEPPDPTKTAAPETIITAPADPTENAKIAIVPIHRQIDDVTYKSLKRRSDEAVAEGATVIVFELDTPGGLVSSSVDICGYIRELSEDRGIKTVAWVRNEAISGGTMIAMACDDIIMSGSSLIGDCGVIMIGMGGASTAQDPALDAKIESYVLAVFESAATRNGYDPLLCDSFVRYEIEVWWLENIETSERRFVDTEEKEELLGENKEEGWASRLLEGQSRPEWRLVKKYVDPKDGKEKKFRQPVVSDTKLLTIDQSKAGVLGFSKKIVRNEKELNSYYGAGENTEPMRIERVWSENLVSWLTSPMVRMILIAMIGMGAYAEFHSPGVGLPGLVAVIALVVFLGAPYLTGLANVWEIVFVVLGIALIAAEVFVIPGFGLAGITGTLILLIGLLATFMPEEPGKLPIFWPEMPQSFDGLRSGVKTLALGMAGSLVGMIVLSRYLPQMPYFKNIMPPNPTPESVIVGDAYGGLAHIGDVGVTESPLRPAGKARFGSLLVDVVTEGDLIDAGAAIRVVERHGNRVVVRQEPRA